MVFFSLKTCQTFDAVDGKQARRTNSSSPLGELFDHGDFPLSYILFWHFEVLNFKGRYILTHDLLQDVMPLHVRYVFFCLLLLLWSSGNFITLKTYVVFQFETMAFGSTAMCGRTSFWFWVISAVPFYCATWEQ